MTFVEVDQLAICYGRRSVLEGIGFHVSPGDVYALLGRNGAGKSSLVRCLLGWQKPKHGAVRLFGKNAWNHRAKAMERTGVVPENPDLPPRLCISELAAFCARLYPRFDEAGFRTRVDRCGVSMKDKAGSLSRGQKAQVALALALAPSPDLLVLDDPTLGLDAVARRTFFESLVVDLAERGVTVLLTTHDLAGAEGVADRVGILHGGKLICDESFEGLKASLRRLRWTEGLPDLAEHHVLRRSYGAFGGEAIVAGWREELAIPGLRAEPLSLEEAFIALTDEGLEVRA